MPITIHRKKGWPKEAKWTWTSIIFQAFSTRKPVWDRSYYIGDDAGCWKAGIIPHIGIKLDKLTTQSERRRSLRRIINPPKKT